MFPRNKLVSVEEVKDNAAVTVHISCCYKKYSLGQGEDDYHYRHGKCFRIHVMKVLKKPKAGYVFPLSRGLKIQ